MQQVMFSPTFSLSNHKKESLFNSNSTVPLLDMLITNTKLIYGHTCSVYDRGSSAFSNETDTIKSTQKKDKLTSLPGSPVFPGSPYAKEARKQH